VLNRALQLLDVPDQNRAAEATRVRALLDGLTLAVCLGRLKPEDAVAALTHPIATVRVAA